MMAEYNVLDTQAFEKFIDTQDSLKARYHNISTAYRKSVQDLMEHWAGRGADAFREDAEKVMANIIGIQDILTTMCDTLSDCREIFRECDSSLGNVNRDSVEKK